MSDGSDRSINSGQSGFSMENGSENTSTKQLEAILNVPELTKPISTDAPCGQNLKYEGTYDKLQEARREENAALPQGVWERELKKADWGNVKSLCVDALTHKTKDLQIAIWLLEALLQLYGFAGVRKGLELILELCETYWEDIFPKSEDGDIETRISPFYWMNEKLYLKLKLIPTTNPTSVDSAPYTFADWENANLLEKKSAKDKNILETAEKQGKVTRAKFLGSVMFSSIEFYARQTNDLFACLDLLNSIDFFLDQKCDRYSPSLGHFRETLDGILKLSSNFLKEKKADDPEFDADSETSDVESREEEKETAKRQPFLSIRNRAEAYRMLSEAADYLLIHEPHSPTPYLVKRAVSWGHMTLTELLQELIADQHNLDQIFNLLGLRLKDLHE